MFLKKDKKLLGQIQDNLVKLSFKLKNLAARFYKYNNYADDIIQNNGILDGFSNIDYLIEIIWDTLINNNILDFLIFKDCQSFLEFILLN